MKKIIVANWKCNPITLQEAQTLFLAYKKIKSKHEIVVCPPFCFLPLGSGLSLGAQDCFWENKGAFTGQVSPLQLKSLGVEYVILGHSEKRALAETNEIINKKLKVVLKAGLKPILCLGETQAERQEGKTFQVVETCLLVCLKGIAKNQLSRIILAYEPVWAVGSGKPCVADEALTMILFLRKLILKKYSKKLSHSMPILYGGSVDSQNTQEYLSSDWVGGLLVGSASLDPKEFTKIAKL